MKKIFFVLSLFFVGCDLVKTPNKRSIIIVTYDCNQKDTLILEYCNHLEISTNSTYLIDGAGCHMANNVQSFSILQSEDIKQTK